MKRRNCPSTYRGTLNSWPFCTKNLLKCAHVLMYTPHFRPFFAQTVCKLNVLLDETLTTWMTAKRFLILIIFCLTGLCHAAERVYFYNWAEYIPEALLKQFTKETGIEVIYTTYDSNEAMYAKLALLKGRGYDLIVPSSYYVSKMRKEDLLQKIDKTKLTNFKQLDPKLLNKGFDPHNEYSIPYMWGTGGIVVNTKKIPADKLQSWNDLWRPELKNQLIVTNDLRDVFHIALRTLGYSSNDTQASHIEQAYQKLVQLLPNIRLYNSEAPKIPILTEEVAAGMTWNGQAYLAQQENPAIQFIYPKEGAVLYLDSLVIPKHAKNAQAAHQLIDFLLRPEIAKQIAEAVGYATPNLGALALLDLKIRNNRTIYPTEAELKNAEFQEDVGPSITVYTQYWNKLKAK